MTRALCFVSCNFDTLGNLTFVNTSFRTVTCFRHSCFCTCCSLLMSKGGSFVGGVCYSVLLHMHME